MDELVDAMNSRSVDGSIRTYDIRAGKMYEEKTSGMWIRVED